MKTFSNHITSVIASNNGSLLIDLLINLIESSLSNILSLPSPGLDHTKFQWPLATVFTATRSKSFNGSISARLIDIPNILSSNSVSVALFSETWICPNSKINIPGYHLVRCDRRHGYGGSVIAISKSIMFRNLLINHRLSHYLSLLNINLVEWKIYLAIIIIWISSLVTYPHILTSLRLC